MVNVHKRTPKRYEHRQVSAHRAPKGDVMTMKLIPLKLLTEGQRSVSFMGKGKDKASTLWLFRSIVKDGLLNPLVVTKQGHKYTVLDGKKRLAVIRKLARKRSLSKAIAKVPCIIQEATAITPVINRRPALLSGPELAHQIIVDAQSTTSLASIAQRFECDISVVEDCLSLRSLHPEILMHFNKGAVSLEQASAFATIANMTAQLDLLHQLGPFVSDTEIMASIKAGATVVELSEDNILFLPSRGHPESQRHQKTLEFGKTSTHAARRREPLAA